MDDESIFLAALGKAPGAERRAFLDEACGSAPALRRRVEILLEADAHAEGILEGGPGRLTAPHAPAGERPGDRVGPYKLLQRIGEGGMGTVYMAEQTELVRRRVALKVVKPGMDSAQVLARFEAERQALALMDHPNIARVLDAGATDSGRPFFVMELVHGVPITRFCDDGHLTLRERLTLFVPVCQAIQHAHQKGIIHRDIKPSNVLVSMYDDRPVPKVIDFGVAKAVEQRLTERTMFTQFGALVGTLEYMSPEQAEMNAFGVDTRSDVYSLGVLLYELLTGTTPLERERLRSAALGELARLIKEEEAPRPSVRLSSSGLLAKVAAARRIEPGRLPQAVRGELDWIVMRCLEKDRTRRYETANGLARDVERYLADEPVEAGPPGPAYRLGKLARRYRTALTTTAALALLLVAGATLSAVLAVRATRAERAARREQFASEAARREALESKAEADAQRDEARRAAYDSGMGLAQRAWDENNPDRARELLAEVPREAGGRDLRGFEWDYLARLGANGPLNLKGHTDIVSHVAFSPDGRRIATASWDRTVKLWDAETGRELLSVATGGKWCVAFNPDGRRIATDAKDNTVKVWDAETGREVAVLARQATPVFFVSFSPDGRRIASCAGDTLKVWDAATGRELLAVEGHVHVVLGAVLSPDGRCIAAGSEVGMLKVWDAATGKELLAFQAVQGDMLRRVAFSPDGRRLAGQGGSHQLKIWDSTTGKELLAMRGHTDWVYGVAFSPDGRRLASGGADTAVRVWDAAPGRELATFRGHHTLVTGVAWSPDGCRLASTGMDGAVKVWDAVTSPDVLTLKGHESWLGGIAFSSDGRRLAAGVGASFGFATKGYAVKVWDLATGRELATLKGHAGAIDGMVFSQDGARLTTIADRDDPAILPEPTASDQTVKVWDLTTGRELSSLDIHTGPFFAVAFDPDARRVASGGRDGKVTLYDTATGRELSSFDGRAHFVDLAFSPDGRRIASGNLDGTLKVWDVATGRELLAVKGHAASVGRDAFIGRVKFSRDGRRLATAGDDGTVREWDATTGRELLMLKGHAGSVDGVAFSPDGRRIASGGRDGKVRLWDADTGWEPSVLQGRAGTISFVEFSPDGRRLAASTSRDGSVTIWEADVPAEVLERRAAGQVVDDHFRRLGLRADVLERLEATPDLSPTRRREALDLARVNPEDASALNGLAWDLARVPGRGAADYRQALRCAEAACRLAPERGDLQTTLGAAYVRVGEHLKALEALERAIRLRQPRGQDPTPGDLAFLAMARQRLGRTAEARESLQQLRGLLERPDRAGDDDSLSLLREAQDMLEGRDDPAASGPSRASSPSPRP